MKIKRKASSNFSGEPEKSEGGQDLKRKRFIIQQESDHIDSKAAAKETQINKENEEKSSNDAAASTASAHNKEEIRLAIDKVLEEIENAPDKTGESVARDFKKLPPKRLYPDYYEVIPEPISLSEIRAKQKKDLYSSLYDMLDDINLMCFNAKHYNTSESLIFSNANTILNIVKKHRPVIRIKPLENKQKDKLDGKKDVKEIKKEVVKEDKFLKNDDDEGDIIILDNRSKKDENKYEK